MNAWTALGGAQLNLTGGEPLLHPRLWTILEAIDRRKTRVILNTNGLLAHRLLDRSTLAPIDALFVSLHTVETHIKNMYSKCEATNKVELILYGQKTGVLK